MRALTRWSVAHRWWVVAAWLVAVVGLQATSAAAGGPQFRDELVVPGTDSQQASDVVGRAFPQVAGDADLLVWRAEQGGATDPRTVAAVAPVLERISEVESVAAVRSPLDGGPGGATRLSADGATAYAQIQFDDAAGDIPTEDIERVLALAEELDGAADIEAGLSGQVVATLARPHVGILELVGLAFAALVLFIAFGSVVAMALPLVSAVAAIAAALGVVSLISGAITVPGAAPVIGVLLGLGVGIDYALFYVSRYRTALREGRSVPDAVAEAGDTSGRAVVFAGITVVISVLGLLLVGLDFLDGLGIAVAVVVTFTVLSAITLLPALLALLGTRVLSRKHRHGLEQERGLDTEDAARETWWVRTIVNRPGLVAALGAALMVVLALPVADLRLGSSDQGGNPAGTATRIGYDLLSDGFGPGVNGPLLLAVETPNAGSQAALPGLAAALDDLDGVASVSPPQVSEDGTAALLRLEPTSGPQEKATSDLIETVRGQIAAPAERATEGLRVHVGGPTAVFDDFADLIADALPVFLAAVIGLSVLLLVLAFRSLVVPLLGGLMNALGAAAAFGVTVAVFQYGWGEELLGVGKAGPIEPFIPVIAFAILFGLSMDYQVFLVSRVHEEWERTGDNRQAVRIGLAQTRPVITAAALIMVFVFAAFVGGDSRIIKLVGFSLAIGVVLDAFVLRQTLVPGLMVLLGRSNWWLPGWLDRILPHVSVEGPAQPRVDVPAVRLPEQADRHKQPLH